MAAASAAGAASPSAGAAAARLGFGLFLYEIAGAEHALEIRFELYAFGSLYVFEVNGFAHLELGNVDFDQFGEVAGTAFYTDFVLVDFEDAVFVLDAVGFAGEVERKNRMHWLAPDDFDKVNVFDGAREGLRAVSFIIA